MTKILVYNYYYDGSSTKLHNKFYKKKLNAQNSDFYVTG